MNFNSKETYLQYRTQWSADHAALIIKVRQAKVGVKEAMRAYAKDNKRIGDIWQAYRDRCDAVEEINEHVTELANARIEAGRQMMAARIK